ncbi:hypothetical protein C5167_042860 [Papaver somniferum]|uniref:Uncharacterized protein n=1 Tax=Papaver somniferum TaxID=3469 RepID=A0A4Y7L5R8_PAPSO|nr:hypothetical protein C5167_042860 [Papaver somniferum]
MTTMVMSFATRIITFQSSPPDFGVGKSDTRWTDDQYLHLAICFCAWRIAAGINSNQPFSTVEILTVRIAPVKNFRTI